MKHFIVAASALAFVFGIGSAVAGESTSTKPGKTPVADNPSSPPGKDRPLDKPKLNSGS